MRWILGIGALFLALPLLAQEETPTEDPFAREMRAAEERYVAGDYAGAAKAYEAALAIRPKEKLAKKGLAASKGYLQRAEAHELAKAGKYDEAIALLKKAKKTDPDGAKFADDSISWVRKLEAAKTEEGKYTGMKQAFDAGNAYLAASQAPQAEAAFRAALVFDAKQPAIHQGLGSALAMQTKYADAEAEYREAVALDPKNATLQYCLGVALAGQGRTDDAEAAYLRAIEIDPKSVLAHNNLATLLRANGRLDEAEKHYRAALDLAPDDAMLKQNLELLLQEKVPQTEPVP